MSKRSVLCFMVLLPLFTMAQNPDSKPPLVPFNEPTLAVLLANRPTHIVQEQWLRMMDEPVNRTLYPLRVTEAMLDSLDRSSLDRRFTYIIEK